MAAIKMFFALALVLALLWAVYRWVRRNAVNGHSPGSRSLIKILENRYLGVKKSIAVVRVPGSVLVIGLGSDRITLLTRIEDPDILSALEIPDNVGKSMSFKDHVKRLTGAD